MMQPAQHECHACCLPQTEKRGIPHVGANMQCALIERVASTFLNILRGSQLAKSDTFVYILFNPLPPSEAVRQEKKIF